MEGPIDAPVLAGPVARVVTIAKRAHGVWQREGIGGLFRWGCRKISLRATKLSQRVRRIFMRCAYGWQPGTLTQRQYRDWILANEPGELELRSQRSFADSLPYQPLISIITPVYNPDPKAFADMLESVQNQTYAHWELCIADASSDNTVRETLKDHSQQDSRIRIKRLQENRGISGNTNEALATAQGEFLAFLDHDDMLAPNYLFEVVNLLNRKPDTDICYFDEDMLSQDGKHRHSPFFKPDWSPEMLCSVNYVTHATDRKSVATHVGSFDPACDGAQDWDFMLRCSQRTSRIEHIAKVLYHWRQMPGSCALSGRAAKPHAAQAQIRDGA